MLTAHRSPFTVTGFMIDLHTHTFFSDGELVPSELARRAFLKGYKVLGISDHADSSNIEFLISALLKLREKVEHYRHITIVPGVELTHVPEGRHQRTDS